MTSPPPPQQPPAPPVPEPRRAAKEPFYRKYGTEAVIALVVIVLLIALIVPTWLLGGFEQRALPRIKAGQTVAYEEVSLRPLKTELWNRKIDGKPVRLLVVTMYVQNRLDERMYDVKSLVTVGSPLFPKPTLAADVTFLGGGDNDETVDPGLPRTMRFGWQVPKSADVPEEIDVTLRKRSYEEDFLADKMRWKNPKPWVVAPMKVTPG